LKSFEVTDEVEVMSFGFLVLQTPCNICLRHACLLYVKLDTVWRKEISVPWTWHMERVDSSLWFDAQEHVNFNSLKERESQDLGASLALVVGGGVVTPFFRPLWLCLANYCILVCRVNSVHRNCQLERTQKDCGKVKVVPWASLSSSPEGKCQADHRCNPCVSAEVIK
jgi:hypothetical protein